MTYREKLCDPRWQKLRLEVMNRDGWRCKSAACTSRQEERVMLVVHHQRYVVGREPWDYAPDELTTLCAKCHDAIHQHDVPKSRRTLIKGRFYRWVEIKRLIGHEPCGYLTRIGQKVVCACFRTDLNPDAPGIVLPGGRNSRWIATARLFQRQGTRVPVFLKAEGIPWEFVGQFRVEALTLNPVEIEIHRKRHGISDIGAVVFLSER